MLIYFVLKKKKMLIYFICITKLSQIKTLESNLNTKRYMSYRLKYKDQVTKIDKMDQLSIDRVVYIWFIFGIM